MTDARARFLKRTAIVSIVAAPFLWFVLAPFPGLGLIYSITDPLRGHPHSKHGTQPTKFVGLWVQEVTKEFGSKEKAFFLMDNWDVADIPSTSQRTWHYDDGRLVIDSVSGCGNCYSGIVTGEYTVTFDGADRMELTHVDGHDHHYFGWYRRVEITDALREAIEQQMRSESDLEARQAKMVMFAIEQYEHKSNR